MTRSKSGAASVRQGPRSTYGRPAACRHLHDAAPDAVRFERISPTVQILPARPGATHGLRAGRIFQRPGHGTLIAAGQQDGDHEIRLGHSRRGPVRAGLGAGGEREPDRCPGRRRRGDPAWHRRDGRHRGGGAGRGPVDARAAVIVIEEAVRRVVERHAAPCREQVHVSLDGGRVHLSGPVASGEDRRAILAALRALPGVDAIDEQLIVADFPGSPVA